MPPKAAISNPGGAAEGYTESELKIALAIVKVMPRPTTQMLEKLAEETGFASIASARVLVRRAATKHDWFKGGPEEAQNTPSTAGRKKKLADIEDGAEEDDTPTKKRVRKSKAPAAAEEKVKQEVKQEGGREGNAEEEGIPVKKRARKPKAPAAAEEFEQNVKQEDGGDGAEEQGAPAKKWARKPKVSTVAKEQVKQEAKQEIKQEIKQEDGGDNQDTAAATAFKETADE